MFADYLQQLPEVARCTTCTIKPGRHSIANDEPERAEPLDPDFVAEFGKSANWRDLPRLNAQVFFQVEQNAHRRRLLRRPLVARRRHHPRHHGDAPACDPAVARPPHARSRTRQHGPYRRATGPAIPSGDRRASALLHFSL